MDPTPNPLRPDLRLSDFDYSLPKDRIASRPARPRDTSRLLVIDRGTERWVDTRFLDLAHHLDPNDLLVINDTRVLKVRFLGTLERTGRAIEVLLVEAIDPHSWTAMARPSRRVRPGDRILLTDEVVFSAGERDPRGLFQLSIRRDGPSVSDIIAKSGQTPLPPYIDRSEEPDDESDYQTIFARQDGAIAAPTAGLHFSDRVFSALADRGIQTVSVTLHVGPGTFVPVRTEDPREHRLQAERYTLSEEAAAALNEARTRGRRIVAVGTTTTRTLEHVLREHGTFKAGSGSTGLYILPGYQFQAVGGLLTNFHLPRTTLLMLVSAFASRELVVDAYKHAIDTGYRFYSYGDATLFL